MTRLVPSEVAWMAAKALVGNCTSTWCLFVTSPTMASEMRTSTLTLFLAEPARRAAACTSCMTCSRVHSGGMRTVDEPR